MSNLLDKASIILTPTAYNNGEALCVKPSDGSGDFDFSRNSAATRVNAQGLVENVQILSSNLVQNGDFSEEGAEEVSNGSFSQEGMELITNGNFDTDTNWVKQTGWSISSGTANCDGANGSLFQNGVVEIGKSYLCEFEIKSITSGSVAINAGGNTTGVSRTSVGTYSEILQVSSGSNNRAYIISQGFNGSIDNVSFKEVGQDWTLGTGWSIGEDAVNFTYSTPSSLIQDLNVTSGFIYLIEYEIVSNSGVSLKGGGNSFFNVGSSIPTTVGLHSFYVTAVNSLGIDFRYLSGSGSLSITNISVKEVGMDWTLGSGWEIGENKVVAVGTYSSTYQDGTTSNQIGFKAKVSFTIEDYINGDLRVALHNDVSESFSSNGKHEAVIVKTTTFDRFQLLASNFNGSVTNISVIEITDDTNLPRINYEGFSYQDALGSELVVNGDFSNGSTDWVVGSDWSISGGTANALSANGTYLTQTSLGNAGKNYLITFTILNYVSGSCAVRFENISTSFNSNGTYTFYTTLAGIRNLDFIPSNFTGSIDNVSVKEYLGQEVVPDSGCGSWLFEPQSTNLVTYSEDFSQSFWTKQASVTLDKGYLAPDGTYNATKISGVIGSSYVVSQGGILSSSSTKSIWAKTTSGTGVIHLGANQNQSNASFTVTNEWQRFEVTGTTTDVYAVDFRNASTTLSEVLVWGAQGENLSYATSYIPTNGEANGVTRNQDVCTNGGSLASINSTEGVLYAEIARSEEENLYRLLGIDDGTSNNYVKMGFENSRGAFWIRAVINGVTSISSDNALTSNPNEFYKIAIRYQSGNSAIYINGTSVLTTTTTFSSGNFTALDFNHWNNSLNFFGKTKALAVWKEALSDQELAELTTI